MRILRHSTLFCSQCSVIIQLPRDFEFKDFRVRTATTDQSVHVTADMPFHVQNLLQAEFASADVRLKAVSALKTYIHVRDSSLVLGYHANSHNSTKSLTQFNLAGSASMVNVITDAALAFSLPPADAVELSIQTDGLIIVDDETNPDLVKFDVSPGGLRSLLTLNPVLSLSDVQLYVQVGENILRQNEYTDETVRRTFMPVLDRSDRFLVGVQNLDW